MLMRLKTLMPGRAPLRIALAAFAMTLLSGALDVTWADTATCTYGTSNACSTTSTTVRNCTREVLTVTGGWECMQWQETTTTKINYWSSGDGGAPSGCSKAGCVQ